MALSSLVVRQPGLTWAIRLKVIAIRITRHDKVKITGLSYNAPVNHASVNVMGHINVRSIL